MPTTQSIPPDDSTLEAWQFLVEPAGQELVEAARDVDPGDVTGITRLRRTWPQHQVAAALELCHARRKAIGRFPDPDTLIADRTGLEQASGFRIAQYKATRFVQAGIHQVLDLCSGIGGDAMALARHLPVIGIDIDPLKAWMTGKNAACKALCLDVTTAKLPEGACHIDPSRRDSTSGVRRHHPAQWQPDASFLETLLQERDDVAIKMGPGIHRDEIPPPRGEHELEFISVEGTLRQAVLWQGRLARTPRSATLITEVNPTGITASGEHPDPAPVGSVNWPGCWLHVPDPALERAELLGKLCRDFNLLEPAPGLGLLCGPLQACTPWLAGYEVVEQMPWRVDRIRKWLRAHDAGLVEIRSRGGAIEDADALRSQFRGDGQTAWTVFGLRLGTARVAIITRPRGHGGDRITC